MNKEAERRMLSHALSEIDLRYVEEAEQFNVAVKGESVFRPWMMKLLPVACICAIIVSAVLMIPKSEDISPGPNTSLQQEQTTVIAGGVPEQNYPFDIGFPWNESNYLMGYQSGDGILAENALLVKYAVDEITEGNYVTYQAGHVIDAAMVGEMIETVAVKSYWYDVPLQKETDTVYTTAEIYTIKNVSPDAAVCARYTEKGVASTTTHYYIYSNPTWMPSSIGELYASTDMEHHLQLVVQSAYVYCRDDVKEITGSITTGEHSTEIHAWLALRTEDMEALRVMLLALSGEAKTVTNAQELDSYIQESQEQARLIVRAYTLSNQPCAIQIFDNGYLMIAKSGTPMLFEIGQENAQQLIERMKQAPVVNTTKVDGTVETYSETSAARPA